MISQNSVKCITLFFMNAYRASAKQQPFATSTSSRRCNFACYQTSNFERKTQVCGKKQFRNAHVQHVMCTAINWPSRRQSMISSSTSRNVDDWKVLHSILTRSQPNVCEYQCNFLFIFEDTILQMCIQHVMLFTTNGGHAMNGN